MSDRDPGIYAQETAVTEIDDGLWQIDLGFQDRAGVIAAYLMAGGWARLRGGDPYYDNPFEREAFGAE